MGYRVEIAPRATAALATIADDTDRWGFARTLAYIDGIEAACARLATSPKRFAVNRFLGAPFRSFRMKAHLVVYEVDDAAGLVRILAIVPSRSNYPETLR
jgi:plasmid stabilization system protein ParE